MSTTLDQAASLDKQDELASFRSRFFVTDPNLIYLDGNSLGRLPVKTPVVLGDVAVRQWGDRLIRSWHEGWYDAPQRIGDKIGQLLGARPGEVVVADSTTVNLYKLAIAALDARPHRKKILSDRANFPSDVYVLEGLARRGGHIVELADEPLEDETDLLARIDGDVALVTLSHTTFKRGFVYDIAAVTAKVHEHGGLVLWDLSHSAGSVPVDFTASGIDLAVGCTYKYLNGGPGSPAWLYVRSALQEQLLNPIQGWFGQTAPFDFELDYLPAAGIRKFFSGTPPTLSLAAIEPGVDLLLEADMDRVRAKSMAQTAYLVELWGEHLEPLGIGLASPKDPSRRGSHISLSHPQAYQIDQALIKEENVIPDFRAPDCIRFGLVPLYTTYQEIAEAVRRLVRVVETESYLNYSAERHGVT